MVWRTLAGIAAAVILPVAALIGGVAWLLYHDTIVEKIGESPANMAQTTGLPFPSDASGIHYFLNSGGLQDLEMFGKFDCPASRAEQILADFIADNDKLMRRGTAAAPIRRTLTAAPFETVGPRHLTIPWWDPDENRIRKAILHNESHAMQFWIMPVTDEVTTIYFYMND